MSEGWTLEEQRVSRYPISESCFIKNEQNSQRALLVLKLGVRRRWLKMEKANIKPGKDGHCREIEEEFKNMGASLVSVRYEIIKGGTAFHGGDKPDFNTLTIKVEFPCSLKVLMDAFCKLKGEPTEDQQEVNRKERKDKRQKEIEKVLGDIAAEFVGFSLGVRREENKLIFFSREEDQREIGQLIVFANGSSTSEFILVIEREGKSYTTQNLFVSGLRPKSYPIFAKTFVEWFLSPDGDKESLEKKLLPVCERIIDIYKNKSEEFDNNRVKSVLSSGEFSRIDLLDIIYRIFYPVALQRGYKPKPEDYPKILVSRLVNKALEFSLSPDKLFKYLNACLLAIGGREELSSPSAGTTQPEQPKDLSNSLRALADKFGGNTPKK